MTEKLKGLKYPLLVLTLAIAVGVAFHLLSLYNYYLNSSFIRDLLLEGLDLPLKYQIMFWYGTGDFRAYIVDFLCSLLTLGSLIFRTFMRKD